MFVRSFTLYGKIKLLCGVICCIRCINCYLELYIVKGVYSVVWGFTLWSVYKLLLLALHYMGYINCCLGLYIEWVV